MRALREKVSMERPHWNINISHTTNGYALVKLLCRVLRCGILTNKAALLRTAMQVQ